MDFKSLIQSLDTINEDSRVHKGTYGTSHGKEDVRDQYGHRVGKVNKGAETKKDEPKKGRGRPKKGAGTSGEHKTYDTSTLGSVFGGGKKPSKEVGKKSVKHSLKDWIEDVAQSKETLSEDASLGVKPLPGASEITMNNQPTGITAKDPQSATKIKDLMATGSISMPGTGDEGVNNSLGEDGFDSEHTGHDPAEYGMEGDFVKNQLHTIARSTRELEEKIRGQEDLPEWVEMKISQVQGMLASVADYVASEHERDVERDTGEEGIVSEKAKSKAQQRFFGMVHAMQKGKKVTGASNELKGVAKDIGKKDAKDFAKTKHKGLPDHVSEGGILNRPANTMQGAVTRTDPNRVQVAPNVQQSVVDYNKKVADIDARNNTYRQETNPTASNIGKSVGSFVGSAVAAPQAAWSAAKQAYQMATDPLDKPEMPVDVIPNPRQGTTTPKESKSIKQQGVEESGLQAYLGNKKYGKDGMDALRDAGQRHASEKTKQNIRAKYSKKEEPMDEGRDEGKPGKNFDKIAKDAGKRYGSKAAGERVAGAVRAKLAKQGKLEESTNMKKLTEGAMKDLLINFNQEVHSHMGDGSVFDLKKAHNVQQAEEILKALVKHGDEYEGLSITNQNELVSQAMKYLAHEKELPFNALAGVDKQRFATKSTADLSKFRQHPATPSSLFNRPGTSMAEPRTAIAPTIKESNDMKDKQFESWEQELNSLLNEGITVSHSTGQQGSPDSLSINATEHDASELMSILRNSGMEMFGGSKEQSGGYGAPEHGGEEEFHQGVEIAPSPEVVGDGDDMLALIKKMSGIGTDAGTPGSVEVDYENEEGSDEDHGEECDDCGHSPCSCDDEGEEELSELTAEHPGGETPLPEGDMDEGNEFSGELAKAKAQHKDHFNVDGKEYPVKEGDMEEGNAFTGQLAKTEKGGEFKMGDKSYKDTSSIEEGAEDCMECGYPMESCECEHVEEGYANDAGGDAMGEAELLHLRELLGRGNDLHRQKHTQATGNIQKVTMETKLLKDTTELLTDWKKLSGIK